MVQRFQNKKFLDWLNHIQITDIVDQNKKGYIKKNEEPNEFGKIKKH